MVNALVAVRKRLKRLSVAFSPAGYPQNIINPRNSLSRERERERERKREKTCLETLKLIVLKDDL